MEIEKRSATQLDRVKALVRSDKFREQVLAALPRHLTSQRFLQVALIALNKTPKLAECTQESLFSALLQLSSLGLEPDGRRAHLIPYGNTCQLIIDYKGLVELVMRSGEVAALHSDVICENDVFTYNRGVIEEHKIDFRKPRGEMYAAYAMATMKNGAIMVSVMTRDEIDRIRDRSKSSKSGPWVTDYSEMSKKTVFRRLSKWLPLSSELRTKIEADDEEFTTVQVDSAPVREKRAQIAEAPPADDALTRMLTVSGVTVAELNAAAVEFGVIPAGTRTQVSDFTTDEITAMTPNLQGMIDSAIAARGGK